MPTFTRSQVDAVRGFMADNPELPPSAVGGYFARIADLETDEEMQVRAIAMLIRDGDEVDLYRAPDTGGASGVQ